MQRPCTSCAAERLLDQAGRSTHLGNPRLLGLPDGEDLVEYLWREVAGQVRPGCTHSTGDRLETTTKMDDHEAGQNRGMPTQNGIAAVLRRCLVEQPATGTILPAWCPGGRDAVRPAGRSDRIEDWLGPAGRWRIDTRREHLTRFAQVFERR